MTDPLDRVNLGREVRTAMMVWRRELIRFVRARTRIIGGLIQPILFLFVLGYGLSRIVPASAGFDYKKFVFPGVVAMSIVTTAIFSGVSIVWDREFGFLREMLVAPVSRTSIILGKTAGGATVATLQGCVMLAMAPVIGVRLSPMITLEVLGAAFLMATALTSFGVFIASRMKKMEAFQIVMQFVLFPMIFLSGAMFPLRGLPAWLGTVTRLDPLTYAVDPMRRLLFGGSLPPAAQATYGQGVTLFGHLLAVWQELAALCAFAAVFLSLAVWAFSRPE